MSYTAESHRYESMTYRPCGKSGLKLPLLSLGLWHNFGDTTPLSVQRELLRTAFDLGITHFDLANNYGPPFGSAEANFGRLLREDFESYRDELVVSTKAGWDMWPGPYGQGGGSRKYLLASLDQSLKRMRLDYVDIFYSHRPDPDTPIEETMSALDHAVRSGKALYAGISNYSAAQTARAVAILRELGTPCLIHQPKYSMFERTPEKTGLFDVLSKEGVGCIAFTPLAQGLLTNRYLQGIPGDSRASKAHGFLKPKDIDDRRLGQVRALNDIAQKRGQSLAQMALAWVLRQPCMTSALIGASRVEQVEQNVAALQKLEFSGEELSAVETIL